MAATDPLALVREHLEAGARIRHRTAEQCGGAIVQAVALLTEAYQAGGKVLLCGNGGSAADCQHLAAELVSSLNRDQPRRAFAAIALTTDTSLLTATANDFGFEHIFERQVEALGNRGDVLIGITTSGNSANVLRALAQARLAGAGTVLLTGEACTRAAELADIVIRVPARDTQQIQEAHLAIGHILCQLVERALGLAG
ncbi:MAG TPA: SIS domain-containing protein [Gemmatimonadales bacterium]|nr:SIS domain-containing protein [Gemmatimonadales bacterium]